MGFPGAPQREVYFMGLIDVLTQYDTKKKAAHAAKTVKHGVRDDEQIIPLRPHCAYIIIILILYNTIMDTILFFFFFLPRLAQKFPQFIRNNTPNDSATSSPLFLRSAPPRSRLNLRRLPTLLWHSFFFFFLYIFYKSHHDHV